MTAGFVASFRSLKWIDYVYYILIEPRRFARMIIVENARPLWGGLLIAAAVTVCDVIAAGTLGVESPFFYYKLTYGAILFFIVLIVKIVVLAGLVDLLCQFIGYQGKVKELVVLVSYGLFPQIFLLPVVSVFKVFHFAAPFFYVFFSIVFFVWTALIVIQGISELHAMEFFRAVLVFLFPYAFLGILSFLSFVLVVILSFGYVSFL
jgi:hypothetical protein